MPLHRDSTLENIHRHHRWEVNNQAGLDALVPDALDIHKVAYKKDDDTYHVLKSVSPTVWVQTAYTKAKVDELLELKQDTLVSGTNIKTINGESVLGSGNLVISGGGAVDLTNYYDKIQTDTLLSNKVEKAAGKGLSTNDFTNTFKQAYDGHLASVSNPHNTTANQVGAYSKSENDNLLIKKANLDINNKIPLSEIPDSILGQLKYMGVWDFGSGLPTGAKKGNYWITSVSGNGYEVGDWAVYNGTSFDKVDNTDAVSSVAGRTGNVVLNKNDVGLNNVDNTSDLNKPISTATQTALDTTVKLTGDQTIAGVKTFSGSAKTSIGDNALEVITSISHGSAGSFMVSQGAKYGLALNGVGTGLETGSFNFQVIDRDLKTVQRTAFRIGIDGVVAYNFFPVTPSSAPTANYQVANKKYVDDNTLLSPNDSKVKTALNASGGAPIYACRAWVNFNGIGTVAIRASGNVSSITDNGIGNYTVNFTTAMVDANYSELVGSGVASAPAATTARAFCTGSRLSTSLVVVISDNNSDTTTDMEVVNVSIFR